LRRLTILLAFAGAALFMLPGVAMAGVSGPSIYVDGELCRTVGTPSDFSHTGAPDHSFDTIYEIAGRHNVATAPPGDRDFNGGRWQVDALEVLTSKRPTATKVATSTPQPRSMPPLPADMPSITE
jgi:hypothetical protein